MHTIRHMTDAWGTTKDIKMLFLANPNLASKCILQFRISIYKN